MKHLYLHIISTEKDNESMADGNGWVSSFAQYLELVIGRMGWNDFISLKIHTNDLERIPKEKDNVLLVVVSKNFLQSNYHSDYVEKLIQKQKNIENPAFRIMKIMKSAIPSDEMNLHLKSLFSYNFYYLDLQKGLLNEYKSTNEFESDDAFWMILVDLCYDILNNSETGMKTLGKGESIFLAEVGADLQHERQLIRRELTRYGYEVLPKSTVSSDNSGLHKQMMQELPKSIFSIHLIGKVQGRMTGDKVSIPAFQYSIASNFVQTALENGNRFKQIVWMQPNMVVADEQQRLFVDNLQRDANSQDNIEIMQMHLEDFKSVIMKTLERESKQKALSAKSANGTEYRKGGLKVYLIADRRDFFASNHLSQWIKEQDIEVLQPNNTNQTTDRTTHIEYLNKCDANLIFYKKATKAWLITKLQDVIKSPGLGRKKPKGPLGVFVTSLEEQKEVEQIKESNIQYKSLQVISNIDGFPYNQLSDFFGEIQKEKYEKIQ